MSKDKKKVLILTLGTGRLFNNEKQQTEMLLEDEEKLKEKLRYIRENNEYEYQKTTYTFENIECKDAEFVAEPLSKIFDPDKVIILGTVRSCWTSFYCRYTQDYDENLASELFRIEKGNGIDTGDSLIGKFEDRITQIFRQSIDTKLFPDVCVVLLRYGINDAQLETNYSLLSHIWSELDEETEYDVAFDITHSFRSIPFYNLIILNYYQNISKYKINIRHVYYGNLEVRSENGNVSPIVDLHDLVDVLQLTNGVSEFKNTGNCTTLLKYIPEEKIELKDALREFESATHMNDPAKVLNALRKIRALSTDKISSGKYTDLMEMIRTATDTSFTEIPSEDEMEKNPLKMADFQYELSLWYWKQTKYGEAMTTSLEALRSYLVYYWQLRKKRPIDLESCRNEANRRNAETQLIRLIQVEEDSPEITFFKKFGKVTSEVKKIRNQFAHNLFIMDDSTENAGSVIDEFITWLSRFHDILYSDQREKYLDAYTTSVKTTKILTETDKCILVFVPSWRTEDQIKKNYSWMKTTTNNTYDVKIAPTSLFKIEKNNREIDKYLKQAENILDYLRVEFPEEYPIVVLDKMNDLQKFIIGQILGNNDVKKCCEIVKDEIGKKQRKLIYVGINKMTLDVKKK